MVFNHFLLLENIENILWGYVVLPALLTVGIYLSWKSKFLQVRRFPYIFKSFIKNLTATHKGSGVHPLKAFFTCIGGCMGVGNVVAVCTAVQIGGPGALLWIWVTAFIGTVLKYSEVYLGMRYRVPDGKGGYRGGPMYFLQRAFKRSWIPKIVCFFLCLYGAEIYQFSIVTENLAANLNINKYFIALALVTVMISISRKGVNNVGRIASIFIPLCIISYLAMGSWVILQNISVIPSMLQTVISSAFSGHAAIGGFAGSSILVAASQGMRRSCYSGDLGVGYASVIHSETREVSAEKQASLTIIEIFLDSFVICTTSVSLILLTGVWNSDIEASMLVQSALAQYFPGMHIYMPLFLLILGFTTIISYFCAGIKCAEFLSPRIGRKAYYVYTSISCMVFVWLQSEQALTVMSIIAAILLLINMTGVYRLRHEIGFQFVPQADKRALLDPSK
ncbi:MAG: amino acid carrier protein [Parachlamydiaceae bacterium]